MVEEDTLKDIFYVFYYLFILSLIIFLLVMPVLYYQNMNMTSDCINLEDIEFKKTMVSIILWLMAFVSLVCTYCLFHFNNYYYIPVSIFGLFCVIVASMIFSINKRQYCDISTEAIQTHPLYGDIVKTVNKYIKEAEDFQIKADLININIKDNVFVSKEESDEVKKLNISIINDLNNIKLKKTDFDKILLNVKVDISTNQRDENTTKSLIEIEKSIYNFNENIKKSYYEIKVIQKEWIIPVIVFFSIVVIIILSALTIRKLGKSFEKIYSNLNF